MGIGDGKGGMVKQRAVKISHDNSTTAADNGQAAARR